MSRLGYVLGGGLLAVGVCGLTAWRVAEAVTRRTDAAEKTLVAAAVPVALGVVTRRDLVEVVRVSGTLRALNEADVVADVPGRVESVLVDVGDTVHAGQPMARLEAGDWQLQVEQAQAALAAAKAGRDTAARDLAGAESLVPLGGVAETQLVAATSRGAAADAQVAQAGAALGLARSRLDDTILRAPFDGVVVRRGTGLGRMVSPGLPAFGVADLSELELVTPVDQAVAASVKPGDRVQVRADVLGSAAVEGVVRTVSPVLDAQSRKAEVVVRLGYSAGLFAHGSATATFHLGRAAGAVAVPSAAIVGSRGEPVVFVVKGGVVRRTPVRIGLREGDWVAVEGLAEGASIVVTGNTYLSDGAPVSVRDAVQP